MRPHFGKPTFQSKLNQIIANAWPTEKVIEVGPTFMERVLNLVDQQYLKDIIAATVGLDHPQWYPFERVMRRVTLHNGGTENKWGRFTREAEALIAAIHAVRKPEVLKARAVTQIANMVVFLERWTIINQAIVQQKGAAAGRQLLLGAVSVAAGGLLIASLVYAGPIVAGAGAFGAGFATDAVVAANLARLGQVAAAGGLGFAGAPTALLLTDSVSVMLEAERAAADNRTILVCEIDKQMSAWKERGVSPYMQAALVGGGIGFGGGLLTLSAAGSKVILAATTFGVGVAQLYALGQLNEAAVQSIAEYRWAIEQQALGNNERARYHLRRSRAYAVQARQRGLESIILASLSASIGGSFKSALLEGESAILKMFANSSDTLPMSVDIGLDTLQNLGGGGTRPQ